MTRPPAFRVVSYNLREGLRPMGRRVEERRRLSRGRVAAAQRLLAELVADVVVVNEALFCEEFEGVAVDYAALFAYPHSVAALYDREWGNVILSRAPVLASVEMRVPERGGLRAALALPGGPVTVACYHPPPRRPPDDKAADFGALLADVRGPRVVCGDFNAISPEDPIDVPALVTGFRRFSPEPEAAVERYLASGRAVFALLERHGLRDAIPHAGRRYTVPTDLLSAEKGSAMRLDHVFVSTEIDVLAGQALHTSVTEAISDHHPVLADLVVLG